jgi:hypothetical protein
MSDVNRESRIADGDEEISLALRNASASSMGKACAIELDITIRHPPSALHEDI